MIKYECMQKSLLGVKSTEFTSNVIPMEIHLLIFYASGKTFRKL